MRNMEKKKTRFEKTKLFANTIYVKKMFAEKSDELLIILVSKLK